MRPRNIFLLLLLTTSTLLLYTYTAHPTLLHFQNPFRTKPTIIETGSDSRHAIGAHPSTGLVSSRFSALGPNVEVFYDLAPDVPPPSSLPDGKEFFASVTTTDLPSPSISEFPKSMMDALYPTGEPSPPPPRRKSPRDKNKLPFVDTWKSPSWFQPSLTAGKGKTARPKPLPKIQHDFSHFTETPSEQHTRESRRDAIRRGFVHSWEAYKSHAWGHDEVRPVSLHPSNGFLQWGASIIDTLETLLIMGLEGEYDLAREHVNRVDFRLVYGKDWARGFRPKGGWVRQGDNSGLSEVDGGLRRGRDVNQKVGVFETGIRYLGGLIGAYDLTGDVLMLERAEDLGRLLGSSFETESGLCPGWWDPADTPNEFIPIGHVLLAEVGSMTLELTRLSQITGNRWYFDRGQRALDYIQQKVIPASLHSPLLPLQFRADLTSPVSGKFGLGGMGDSYYEYLIKQHQLVGGATEQYREMYVAAVEKAGEVLLSELGVFKPAGRGDYVVYGSRWDEREKDLDLEHLVCFAGAMLGLGSRLLKRPGDLSLSVTGKKLTNTCYWAGASEPSGLQPEIVTFYSETDPTAFHTVKEPNQGTVMELDARSSNVTLEKRKGYRVDLKNHGVKTTEVRYIGRPETIESVFYMFRLTGDKVWRDKGWRMFASWAKACQAVGGMSSTSNAQEAIPPLSDNMESFVFAETFKYHFLLQSEPDLISLDDYVFSTEAHTLIANNGIVPGSQGFWTAKGKKHPDPAERAIGSHAQLWERHKSR